MNSDSRIKFIGIVILAAICAYVVAPIPNKPHIPGLADAKINRGIDLAGGGELRYKLLFPPDFSGDKQAALTTSTDVIRRRVEARQLKEPKITSHGSDEIVIQLAGVDEDGLNDYKRLIETAGKLELHAAAPKDVQEKYNRDKTVPAGYKVVENPDPRPDPEYAAYGAQILIKEETVIEGRHITLADAHQRMEIGGSRWATTFELDNEGAKLFDDAAKMLFNQRPPGLIVIMLDGKVKSAPRVNSESFHGRGEISGARDQNEARDLAIILRSGSLPVSIGRYVDGKPVVGQPEARTFVGPTLGEDAIRRGLLASAITMAMVVLFMLAYYRTAGVIAVITLFLNLAFLLAIMAFFQATLTLPGLAGIVLTIGMAVDASILIYERMREEQAKGKSATQAFEAGFDRAFWAIMDSNVTTLIVGIVLYYFGTGPVQGFAVTLCIGIVTTLFSVLFCSKVFLKMLLSGGLKEWKMMKLMAQPKLEFLKYARACVLISGIAVVAGTIFFSMRLSQGAGVGIDFKGGAMVSFAMNEPQSIQEVRSRIQQLKGDGGLPKYSDAEVQTVADPEATAASKNVLGGRSRTFQMRTSVTKDADTIRKDLQEIFKDTLSHVPFEEMDAKDVPSNPREMDGQPAGPGLWIYVRAEKADVAALRKKIAESGKVKDLLQKTTAGAPNFKLDEIDGAPKGHKKLRFLVTKKDAETEGVLRKIRDDLKHNALADVRAQDPFLSGSAIGSTVAKELTNSTFWAMAASWALMIVYVAVRFESWRYGVAAVIALVHDSLISLAFVSLADALVPRAWGLSFEMNLTTMAAILTIIGYAINDKIVVFDRIRENLILMKKESFATVINTSVNQTMSRTILTGVMVWVAAIVMYGLTMHTGGGIAEFSFPLIIGLVAGTYSTIYIAAPIVLWWYGGHRPTHA